MPRFSRPPADVQRNARFPTEPLLLPVTVDPSALMAFAKEVFPPENTPRLVIVGCASTDLAISNTATRNAGRENRAGARWVNFNCEVISDPMEDMKEILESRVRCGQNWQ